MSRTGSGPRAVRFSDGVAALRAALDVRTNANSEIVCGVPISPPTLRLLVGPVPAAGRTVRFVDLDAPGALAGVINRRTRVVLVEPGAGSDLREPGWDPIVEQIRAANAERFEEERVLLVIRSSTVLRPAVPSGLDETLIVRDRALRLGGLRAAGGEVSGADRWIVAVEAHRAAVGGHGDARFEAVEPDGAAALADAVAAEAIGHEALAAVTRREAFPTLVAIELAGSPGDAARRAERFAAALVRVEGVASESGETPDPVLVVEDPAVVASADARTVELLGRRPGRLRLAAMGGALGAGVIRRALDASSPSSPSSPS